MPAIRPTECLSALAYAVLGERAEMLWNRAHNPHMPRERRDAILAGYNRIQAARRYLRSRMQSHAASCQ